MREFSFVKVLFNPKKILKDNDDSICSLTELITNVVESSPKVGGIETGCLH